KTLNSGGSRKRPVLSPDVVMALPQFSFPYPRSKPPVAVPNAPYEVLMLPVRRVIPCPERVVTLMTRLVLSPDSAGGAPSITSIDSIESEGVGLEKVLLC